MAAVSEGLVVVLLLLLFVWLTLDVGWEVTWKRLEVDGRVRRRRGGKKWSRKGELQENFLFGFGRDCAVCVAVGVGWVGQMRTGSIYEKKGREEGPLFF